MTGTTVSSDLPVQVLSACNGCYVKDSAADPVQEVMLPVSWWGTTAIAAASTPLTKDITNVFRILASQDGTTVTTDPPMPATPALLNRGSYLDIESLTDFAVSASKPILVARFNTYGLDAYGDPAMCLMLPPERFIQSAVFGLPVNSEYRNWIDVVARPGTAVTVDGVLVPAAEFVTVAGSGFSHARVSLSNTVFTHTIDADQPVGAYAGLQHGALGMTFPVGVTPPPNLAPICNAGGPYAAPCAGPVTRLPLSAASSSDPENRPLAFRWTSTAAVSFDDATRADAVATVAGLGFFALDLEVSDGVNRVSCRSTITLTGDASVPPELGRFATPLLLARRGGDILFAWRDLGAPPMAYNVYEGTLRSFWSHAPLACSVAGAPALPGRREETLTPSAGSSYYQVSASNCFAEGPSGADPALETCPP